LGEFHDHEIAVRILTTLNSTSTVYADAVQRLQGIVEEIATLADAALIVADVRGRKPENRLKGRR
jgi:hypothetical protein